MKPDIWQDTRYKKGQISGWPDIWYNSIIYLLLNNLKDCSGNLVPASWEDAIVAVAKALDSTPADQIAAVAGGMADGEALTALKDLMNRLGSELCCTEEIFPDVIRLVFYILKKKLLLFYYSL